MLLFVIFMLTSCRSTEVSPKEVDHLKIVATTTIVGDVVAEIGGDLIDLSVLLPVGTDPHSFSPNPQDIAKVAEADLVFANGAGLEEFLDPLIESAGAAEKVIRVSDGIDFLMAADQAHDHENGTEENDGKERHQVGVDPHAWTDPNNVKVWVRNIAQKLSEVDPGNAQVYAANADTYDSELDILDAWIRKQVAQVPKGNRKLVTDHTLFGYFVNEYGFEQIGALIPSYSTLAEPTAQELAAIEDAIHKLAVKAIFVGNTVNPDLAERIAEDTGTQIIFVYTGSLSETDGEAPTYLDYMRYNTIAFVDALK
jgi:ABC-type Zn uptake system ZnuABC Zn-binding protein ZnuA